MKYSIRLVSSYPPRVCGIGRFSENLATALERLPNVGDIRVAAIADDNRSYSIPVDIVIDQYDPKSWREATSDIKARDRTDDHRLTVILQHEYGLDGKEATGTNYVDMAKSLHDEGLMTMAYLHTVLRHPNAHQSRTLQALAENTDRLLVTLSGAIDILDATYGIDRSKITHVDHGIRMRDITRTDRLLIKQRYGLEDKFLATTLGLLSPDKGIHYGVRAYARFLDASCTEKQRKDIVYLIAGQYHPGFVESGGGEAYREYRKLLRETLADSGLRYCEVEGMGGVDFDEHDVCFLYAYLNEDLLRALYGATNTMILPYLNPEQVSSGILADTIGSGRVPISSKTMCARELLGVESEDEGAILTPRGVLVDPAEPSVDQIAQGLDYLVFNEKERFEMERNAGARGYEMRWDNSAWKLMQYIGAIEEDKSIVTGRGHEFTRERESQLKRLDDRLLRRK